MIKERISDLKHTQNPKPSLELYQAIFHLRVIAMYPNLEAIGITDVADIEHYRLRTEKDSDVLKIYYRREKGSLFARSQKFIYPRQQTHIRVDGESGNYQFDTEISPALRMVVEELDAICNAHDHEGSEKELILKELKYLEQVVVKRIAELEYRVKNL